MSEEILIATSVIAIFSTIGGRVGGLLYRGVKGVVTLPWRLSRRWQDD